MIIFNITTWVSWRIHARWMQWLMEDYLPAVLSTDMFERHQLVRLLEADNEDGPTYALQLYLRPACSIDDFRRRHLSDFQQKEKDAWGEEAFSFSSLMEVVN